MRQQYSSKLFAYKAARLWVQDFGVFAPAADVAPPYAIPAIQLRFKPGRGILTFQQVWAKQTRRLFGQTQDSNGNPLPNCVVKLYATATDNIINSTTSDSNGYFEHSIPFYPPTDLNSYYLVAYLPGSPDVAGTTVNNLRLT